MKKPIVPTNIKKLREVRGMSLFRLGESIGATLVEMEKIENGVLAPNADQIAKLAAALKVNSYVIFGLPIDDATAASFDDAQISYTIGWLLEAAGKAGVVLSQDALADQVIRVCKTALDKRLNFDQNRELAFKTIGEIKDSEGKESTVVPMQEGIKRRH